MCLSLLRKQGDQRFRISCYSILVAAQDAEEEYES